MPDSATMQRVLIVGGTHGVEPQSAYVAENLAKFFDLKEQSHKEITGIFTCYMGEAQKPDIDGLPDEFYAKHLTVVPNLNRYGLQNNTRGNARGVDLNRNMPSKNWSSTFTNRAYFPGTHPASEKEVQLLVRIIDKCDFSLIISIHTNHYITRVTPPQVNFDGPQNTRGHKQGQRLAELLSLPFTHDIGYITNGSLGSYAKDKDIPCVTLEMDDTYTSEGAWAKYGFEIIKLLAE